MRSRVREQVGSRRGPDRRSPRAARRSGAAPASRRRRCAAADAITVSLMRRAPDEPPVTSRTGRRGSSPNARAPLGAGRRAVELLDLAAQRQADDPARGGSRVLAKVTPTNRVQPGAEAVRESGPGVRLVDGDRAPARGVRRGRRAPTRSRRSRRRHPPAVRADARVRRRPSPRQRPGKRSRSPFGRRGNGSARDGQQLVAALGHEPGLEPLGGAEHEHRRAGIALAQPVGGREQRVDVAGGAAAGEQVGGHRGVTARAIGAPGSGRCRANDSTMPIAVRVVISAEPPAETSGSGTPSTGQQPEHDGDVDERLADDPDHGGAGRELRERVAVIRMMRTKQTASTTKSASTRTAPIRPSSSPMIAKMKSLAASGSQDHLPDELPRPTPKTPPCASASQPWIDCQQSRGVQVRVRALVQPGGDAVRARVAQLDRRPARRARRRASAAAMMRSRTPAKNRAPKTIASDDRRRAEVVAGEHEADGRRARSGGSAGRPRATRAARRPCGRAPRPAR